LVLLESSLNSQSAKYEKLLAQGDIAAADALEAERLRNLQATVSERQEMEHKLAAAERAETILKKEAGICSEMLFTAQRNLLVQNITHVMKPRFDKQFIELQETYLELSKAIAARWGGESDKWKHKETLQELLDKTGRDFIMKHYHR
jgi:hypothetical protein